MQIGILLSPVLLLLFAWISLTIQDFVPAPAPDYGTSAGSSSVASSPIISDAPALPPVLGVTVDEVSHRGTDGAPAPVPGKEQVNAKDKNEDKESGEIPATTLPPEESGLTTVNWCAVREEFVDCQYYLSLLKQADGYAWKCVKRETTQECLDAIKKGEADLINMDPGLAYIAFQNYSMKAIMNEVYCNHAESYNAVAVVNGKVCTEKEDISLRDFKGRRSCHGGYLTATGWNYPLSHIKMLLDFEKLNDREMVTGFFSEVCSPSEFEGMGICSGCGNENASCHSNSLYSGHSGAFRCLVEEMGDIAFMKGNTALLYSMEGPYNQTWSTKPISDFMYLCPQGGCREINGYPGACSFGTVPANVIMASNSISSTKRSVVLQTLLNATWLDALYTGKNEADRLISSSAQGLTVVKKLTRSYLGESASISQSIQELNAKKVQIVPSTVDSVSDAPSSSSPQAQHPWVFAILSFPLALMFPAFFP